MDTYQAEQKPIDSYIFLAFIAIISALLVLLDAIFDFDLRYWNVVLAITSWAALTRMLLNIVKSTFKDIREARKTLYELERQNART